MHIVFDAVIFTHRQRITFYVNGWGKFNRNLEEINHSL